MPIIYCSACADTSHFPGESCLHCGAVAEESYDLTGHSFTALIVVMAVSVGLVWAFTRNLPPPGNAENVFPEKTSAAIAGGVSRAPGKISRNQSATPQRLFGKRDVG